MAKPFQFRLRTMLLAIVPVALVALPLGYYLRRPRPPQTVPVSGIVTLDGVPANGAIVVFYPGATPAVTYASDITNSAGKFRLDFFFGDEMEQSQDGCVPGLYKVAIARHEATGRDIPDRYAEYSTSCLTAKVTRQGLNVFTFNLTTP